MKRLIPIISLVTALGCGGIAPRYLDDSDAGNDGADAAADVYTPDSDSDSGDAMIPDAEPDADASVPDSDLDSIVVDGSSDSDTGDAAVCDSGLLNFLNQQGITYGIGDVLLNGDGSFEASSNRGWYRNSSSIDENNVAVGDYLVFSRATTGMPGMTGVTRILEYTGYNSTANVVQFRDIGTSGVMNGVVNNDGVRDLWGINVGGYSFGGTIDTATGRISPRLDGGDVADGHEVLVYTAEGDKTMEELLCPDVED